MIGDSLTSDIRGGSDYEIDTCWFNWRRQPAVAGLEITHEITELAALIDIVLPSP